MFVVNSSLGNYFEKTVSELEEWTNVEEGDSSNSGEQAAELERQMKTAEKSVAAAPAEGTKEMTVDALLALVPEKDHASLMAKVSEVRKFVGAGVSDAVIIVALLVGGILDLNKSKTTMAEAARKLGHPEAARNVAEKVLAAVM